MNRKEHILEDLINEEFSEEQLFEQYKLYVEMADHVSERRDKTNRFYLSLFLAIFTLLSAIFSISSNYHGVVMGILICSILICINWYQNILSYQRLNGAKFDVINCIENRLASKGFTIEYKLVKLENHKNLTKIEMNIPIFFIILFGLIFVWIIVDLTLKFFPII